MIPIQNLITMLNNALNLVYTDENRRFLIVADGDDYAPPTRQNNTIIRYVNGVAQMTDNSITVINGLYVSEQVLTIEVAVWIDPDEPKQASFEPVRNAISAVTQTPKVQSMEDENGNVYSVTYYGTQPSAGEIMQRPDLGESITYTFSVFFTFIQNGINSLGVTMTFEGEPVPFTELTPSVTPVMEAGAFSETNGSAENYPTTDALQITLTVPALTDSLLTQEFAKYILTKERKVYDVTLEFAGVSSEYRMIFSQSNFTARGAEGVGQSIILVEALEAEDE